MSSALTFLTRETDCYRQPQEEAVPWTHTRRHHEDGYTIMFVLPSLRLQVNHCSSSGHFSLEYKIKAKFFLVSKSSELKLLFIHSLASLPVASGHWVGLLGPPTAPQLSAGMSE